MSDRIEAPGWSYEEILADLKETARVNRLKRLAQAAPKPPEQKLAERCAAKPTEAVIDTATRGNDAAIERLEETMESRRQKQMAKELAEHNAEGPLWHRLVNHWQQSIERAQRALDDEIPEKGVYSPIRRFEREMRGK